MRLFILDSKHKLFVYLQVVLNFLLLKRAWKHLIFLEENVVRVVRRHESSARALLTDGYLTNLSAPPNKTRAVSY